MHLHDIRALYDYDERITAEEPHLRREVTQHTIRQVNTEYPNGFVIHSKLDGADVEAIIRGEIDYFLSIGHDFEWKVYDYDQPPDLKERLAVLGLTIEEEEAILVLDAEQTPEKLSQPIAHDVRRITTPEGIEDVIRIESEVWQEDFDWLRHRLNRLLKEYPNQVSIYVAYVDDTPVSAGWTRFPPESRFASLWGGSTLEAHRGRGLFTAMVARRLQEARQRGYRFLTVDASPMSRPILEKLGFQLIALSYPCKWSAKLNSANL